MYCREHGIWHALWNLDGEDQVEYCILMASIRFNALHPTAYLHDIASTGVRFYAYGREAELDPGEVMGYTVNNLPLRGSLEVIIEGISDIHNTNGDMVCGWNVNNQPECR